MDNGDYRGLAQIYSMKVASIVAECCNMDGGSETCRLQKGIRRMEVATHSKTFEMKENTNLILTENILWRARPILS